MHLRALVLAGGTRVQLRTQELPLERQAGGAEQAHVRRRENTQGMRGRAQGGATQQKGHPVSMLSLESLNMSSFLVASCYGNFEAGGGTGKRPGLHPEATKLRKV